MASYKARQLRAAMRRHGKSCFYCGRAISQDVPLEHPARATADHRIPKSQGGTMTLDNIVPACRPCNQLKADGRLQNTVKRKQPA